jgi:hypothetical protein
MKAILKDIKSGALPLGEIPGFVLYLLRQSFWFWFVIIIAFAAGWLIKQ